MPSEIEKEASIYSKACKKVKKTPRKIVRPKLISEDGLSPKTMALWDQVQVAPESSNITVLSKGTSQGFKTSIPGGGHTPPISKAGDKLEAKKAQKKANAVLREKTARRMALKFEEYEELCADLDTCNHAVDYQKYLIKGEKKIIDKMIREGF